MASKLCKLFSVTRQAPELVVPASPTPLKVEQLSGLDVHEILLFQIQLIFFYKNKPSTKVKRKDPVELIKEALRRALVFYYPLAGRIKELEGSNGKVVVDCTGEGVLFTEADANFKLEDLGEEVQTPCPYLDQLLYDIPGSDDLIGCPLLLIQVTRFKCGGLAFAVRLNHIACDAFGLTQFLKAIGEMVGGACTPSLSPVWQRDFLNSRDPQRITCTHHEYEENKINNTIVRTTNSTDINQIDQKSFYFGPIEINALREHLPLHLKNCCSTFELLTACMWKCRTVSLDLDPDEIVGLSCAVNLRVNRHNINISPGFYGNAVLFPTEYAKVDHLCKRPLGYAVELVKKAKSKMIEEYVRSAKTCMVITRRQKFDTSRNFVVSDNTCVGFDEVDLGWGKPVFSGVAKATPLVSFLIKHENSGGEFGILIPICLPNSTMERFQKELKKMIQGRKIKVDLCSKI